MSVITMSTTLSVGQASIGQARYDMVEQSETTGTQSVRTLGPPRWSMSLRSRPVQSFTDAKAWETMVWSLRGRVNHLAAYDPGRPVPQGTYLGAMQLDAAIAAGATSMTINGGTVGTLIAGDWLQIGTGLGTSQLVKVMADATSVPSGSSAFSWTNAGAFSWTNGGAFTWNVTGIITVTFEPPARQAFGYGTAVTWDHPVAYYKAQAANNQMSYTPGFVGAGEYSLDLLEAFS
jgi:hypothetical protein